MSIDILSLKGVRVPSQEQVDPPQEQEAAPVSTETQEQVPPTPPAPPVAPVVQEPPAPAAPPVVQEPPATTTTTTDAIEVKVGEPAFDPNDFVRRTFGEEYGSVDSLKQSIEAAKAAPQIHDSIKELNDALLSGKINNPAEVIEWQNKDFSKMPAPDKLVEGWKLADPGITEKEINYKLGEYGILFKSPAEKQEAIENGDYSGRELEALEAKLERELRTADKSLNEYRESKLVDLTNNQSQTANNSENDRLVAEQTAFWKSELKQTASALEADSVKIGDDVEYKFKYAPEQVSAAVATLENPPEIFSQLGWIDKEGKPDHKKMISDTLLIKNKKEFINAIISQAATKGAHDVIKDINNVDFTGKAPAQPAGVDPRQQLIDKAAEVLGLVPK